MYVFSKYISLVMFIFLTSCNNSKDMIIIKNLWGQLVNSETIEKEGDIIRQLCEVNKEDNTSFTLLIVDELGNEINYNDFHNQNIKSVSVDFHFDDAEYKGENWKPLDVNNISLFFLE